MRESMREAVSELREKADNKMTPEEVDDLLQSKMPGEEREVPQGFLEEIIGQAKLVQEILDSLGTMLIEVQKNLHLLPADSQQRILQASQQVIEHHRQRQAKAEIQRILEEGTLGEWSEDDSTTSGESAMIYTEATETIEPQENPEEEWTTPQNMVPMVKHAQLHWLGCFDQTCQTHQYKEYNVLSQGQEYRCQGKEKISWKECTNDSCEGHVKPKI